MAFPPYGTTVPTLSSWQVSYSGVTVGAGTAYGILGATGIGDLPAVNTGDIARPRDQGELRGLDFIGGRDLTLDLQIWTPGSGSNLQALQSTLAGVTNPNSQTTETPLWIQLPNLPLLASMARPRKRTIAFDIDYSAAQVAKPIIQWHATDPRLYAAPQQSSVSAPTALGGMTFPATFPLSFGGGSSVGVITANNAGNVEMRPILVLTGPLTSPTVTNSTTGWSLTFTNPAQTSFTLNAGDTLTVDTDLHTVSLVTAGTTIASPRRNWIVAGSTWPSPVYGIGGLAPGNNTVTLATQGASDTGTLALQWASAYII